MRFHGSLVVEVLGRCHSPEEGLRGIRKILKALHDTGRITRQEAVSMLPVIALAPKPCYSPGSVCITGSKTTQICEHLGDSGVVIANEVVRGRVNTLVSNIQRHSSRTAVVVQHDGRHIPKVPSSGFDYVLADVPCTGSGTTRKNPKFGKSGFLLQEFRCIRYSSTYSVGQ